MSDRFYVSLTATVDEPNLHTVPDRMSAVIPQVADAGTGATVLEGLSLSFTRSDDDGLLTSETVTTALPVAGPVTNTGPGAPPPDAVGLHAAEEVLPTAPVPTDTDGSPA